MSYRAPPGSTGLPNSGRSTPQTHGLPARPPAPAGGSQNASVAFKPRAVASATPAQQNHSSTGYDMSANPYSSNTSQSYYQQPDQYAAQYGGNYGGQASYGQDAPQIRNPFAPTPAGGAGYGGSQYGNAYDPEYQAQIQQWQSQYSVAPDPKTASAGKPAGNANNTPLGQKRDTATPSNAQDTKQPVNVPPETDKTVVRKGGGQSWEDSTLLEWGNHHRLFVGNLAGEVTDESLLKAFSKFPSVQKARVIRDKRTTKSKGFGFVSLADADEYFQAAKEMQGKYIGSHPVLIRRAETEIKAVNKKDDRNKYNKNKGKGGNQDKNSKDILGSNTGAGVKKNTKPESKYKMLG